MKITERRKHEKEFSESLAAYRVERVKNAVLDFMNSPGFKLSASSIPEGSMNVDALVSTAVAAVTDPVGDMRDTFRAKGFRPAEIRNVVHRIYIAYIYDGDPAEGSKVLYEDMVQPVAEFMMTHQEIYNYYDVERMRQNT